MQKIYSDRRASGSVSVRASRGVRIRPSAVSLEFGK